MSVCREKRSNGSQNQESAAFDGLDGQQITPSQAQTVTYVQDSERGEGGQSKASTWDLAD
jgi:hypothetical protein